MKRFGLLCGLVVFISLAFGCNPAHYANFRSERRLITIETEPSGAEVFELNFENMPIKRLGTTPLVNCPVLVVTAVMKMKNIPAPKAQQILQRVGCIAVRIEKRGYLAYTAVLTTEHGQTIAHKIKLTPG